MKRAMDATEAQGILAFIKRAENLKNTLRFSFTSEGKTETTAEHSWRLCLLIMVCGRSQPDLDLEKCLKMAVIHDLAEAVCGDTPAIFTERHKDKAPAERAALALILEPLPEEARQEITALWEEYECAASEEAIFVKALDKLETLIQHNQGRNPAGFDYSFNLTYGLEATGKADCAARLRVLVDAETKARAAAANLPGERA